MIALLLLLQATAPAPAAVKPDPLATLHQTVVDAIRNCGTGKDDQVVVCSRDRGFAEGERPLRQKLVKPVPVTSGPPVTVTVVAGPGPAPRTPDNPE